MRRLKSAQNAFLFGLVVAITAIMFWWYVPSPPPSRPVSQALVDTLPESKSASHPVDRKIGQQQQPQQQSQRADIQILKKKYGSHFNIEYSEGGALSSIRNTNIHGSPKSTLDPLNRAKQILKDFAAYIDPRGADLQLQSPLLNTQGPIARVSFQQTYGGLAVEPHGTITVSLGPSGELISLYSDYLPAIEIADSKPLEWEEAWEVARKDLEQGQDEKISDPSTIIWVTEVSKEGSKGRRAYQTWQMGRRIVVDASSGRVIINRDERQY